jgi:CheY-like chemotaxis protein
MHGDRERFLAAGFDDHIPKPLNLVEFLRTVEHHCAGRRRSG